MTQRVAVLYGGLSAEREISLQSGKAVISALKSLEYDVVPIDVGTNLLASLMQQRLDLVFNCLHGPGGEDGIIPAILEQLQLPYTGSSILGASLAMDKMRSKKIWQAEGLPVLPGILHTNSSETQQFITQVGFPLAVKPVYEGSSIGVTKVVTQEELAPAIVKAQAYGDVMLEPWIHGSEYTVGIVDTTVLPAIKIVAGGSNFYDYTAKYKSQETQYLCPAGLSVPEEAALAKLCQSAFFKIACSGWGRVDLIRKDNGDFAILEVNTVPGMTKTSLLPKAAKQKGWSYAELVNKILATAKVGNSAMANLKMGQA